VIIIKLDTKPGELAKQTGNKNMADFQFIQCKQNQLKTSSNRQNIVALYKETGLKESNAMLATSGIAAYFAAMQDNPCQSSETVKRCSSHE